MCRNINGNDIFIILFTKNTLFDGVSPPTTRITHLDPDCIPTTIVTEKTILTMKIKIAPLDGFCTADHIFRSRR